MPEIRTYRCRGEQRVKQTGETIHLRAFETLVCGQHRERPYEVNALIEHSHFLREARIIVKRFPYRKVLNGVTGKNRSLHDRSGERVNSLHLLVCLFRYLLKSWLNLLKTRLGQPFPGPAE